MAKVFRNLEHYSPDIRTRQPQVTVQWNSLFAFGAPLKREFKNKSIDICYWPEEKSLIIYVLKEGGHLFPEYGLIHISPLVRRIHQEGISFPARFVFVQEEPNTWVGTLDIRNKIFHHKVVKKVSMVPELALEGYGWILDKVVASCAKTTPIAERRQIATQALLKAAYEYTERDGPLREYFFDKIKAELVTENRQNTKGYSDVRLDKPIENPQNGSILSAYELMPDENATDHIDSIEDRIADAQFAGTCLNEQERMVFGLLNRGYQAKEIIQRCKLDPEMLYEMCAEIGDKRKAFLSAG